MFDLILKALISVLPPMAFLVFLIKLDSHRLIGQTFLAKVFAGGGIVAVMSYFVNSQFIVWLDFDLITYSRSMAPVVEESLKALVLVGLFRRDRVGFQVDAAILGFSIGAGFSFIENLYYLFHVSEAHYFTWVIRGFGTAIMHGGCTALFAVVSQILTERHRHMNPVFYLPGLLAAILFHAVFNLFPISPVLSTVVTLTIIPTVLFLLFERNEVTIHNFLEQDFNLHRRLLDQLEGGEFSGCETGRFIRDVGRLFQPPTNDQMIHYIHLHTELILSAEGVLLARESGIDIVVETATHEKIGELHFLEKTIGKAGMHALTPHLQLSKHEFWVIHQFEEELAHPNV